MHASRPLRLPFLPLWLGMSYIVATFVLFLVWPIDWPITSAGEWTRLILYVLATFGVLILGYTAGRGGRSRPRTPLDWRPVFYAGSALSILLLVPLVELQTGRSIGELPEAFRDQVGAYNLFQAHMSTGAASNFVVSLIGALSAPFVFAVTPLAILRWKTLGLRLRVLFFATISCSMVLSTMRGTDRELANLFIVVGSAALVALARNLQQRRGRLSLVGKYWMHIFFVFLFAYVGATITTGRKEGRLGGFQTACLSNTGICADLDSPVMAWMSDRQKFGLSFFILEVSQGYYGLDLALGKDFRTTWGLGHAPPLMNVYTRVTGDTGLQENAFTFRDSNDGWSDQNYWSTMIIWFANDVGFVGAIGVLGVMAFLWGRSWRDATVGQADEAAIFFCLMMIMVAYFPANNQVFINLDGYFTFLYWLVAWLVLRSAARRRPVTSVDRSAMAQ